MHTHAPIHHSIALTRDAPVNELHFARCHISEQRAESEGCRVLFYVHYPPLPCTKLVKCFHPKAIMTGILVDKPIAGTPELYLADIDRMGMMAAATTSNSTLPAVANMLGLDAACSVRK